MSTTPRVYTKAAIVESRKRVVQCPACGKGWFDREKMAPGKTFSHWLCPSCGTEYDGRVTEDGVELAPTGKVHLASLALLKRHGYDTIYLVVRGFFSDEETAAYYYNEGTCPTNYLGVECVVEGGVTDPHGCFEYVGLLPNIVPADLEDDTKRDTLVKKLLDQFEIAHNLVVDAPKG